MLNMNFNKMRRESMSLRNYGHIFELKQRNFIYLFHTAEITLVINTICLR